MIIPWPFSPLVLRPALWLDASDASTLYSGASLAAADGAISEWRDKSGNARHATQATGVSQPLRKTAIQNGRDVVRFDGSNDKMLSTVATSRDQFTVFMVADKISGDATDYRITSSWGSGAQGTLWMGHIITTGARTASMSYASNDISSTASAATTLFCSTVTGPTSRSLKFHQNGILIGASTTAIAARPSDAFHIGQYPTGLPCNANISEILVFPTALSDTNRQAVENFLNSKWAIY